MLKWILEKISSHYLGILLASPTVILSALSLRFHKEAETLISTLTPTQTTLILLLLTVVSLALLSLSIYLSTWFKYIPKYQFYQHRINRLYYCPPCRNKKPLSPLKKEKSGWRCPFCKSFYKDPDYVHLINDENYMPSHRAF